MHRGSKTSVAAFGSAQSMVEPLEERAFMSVTQSAYLDRMSYVFNPQHGHGAAAYHVAQQPAAPTAATGRRPTIDSPKVQRALSDLFDAYAAFNAGSTAGRTFTSPFPHLQASGDYVTITATARPGGNRHLLRALTALGIKGVQVTGGGIQGQFPIGQVPSLAGIKWLGTATAAYASNR